MSKIAAVRVRSGIDINEEVNDTLQLLGLNRPNHCTVLEDDSTYRGMLEKAKDLATWGSIEPDVLSELLRERGELNGGGQVTDDKVQEETSYETVEEFAKAVCDGESSLEDMEGLKKVFRLRPPKKGYNSTRLSFQQGGAVGDREEKINDLLLRMI